MRSRTTVGTVLGVICFAVGLYGYVVLGWRFGDGNSLGTAIGVVVALAAIALTVLGR